MKKNTFSNPYLGVSEEDGLPVLTAKTGEISIVFEIENLALQFSADPDSYTNSHNLYSAIIKTMGRNSILQKIDIIYESRYNFNEKSDNYLSTKYHEHFKGRLFKKIKTNIVLTQPPKKGKFFTYDEDAKNAFIVKAKKLKDLLSNAKAKPRILNKIEINKLVRQAMVMNFDTDSLSVNNFSVKDTHIEVGDKSIRCMPLIDIDTVSLPTTLPEYKIKKEITDAFPVDFMGFLHEIPHCETIVYNQIVSVPDQRITTRSLELKKKRHSAIPDAGNTISMNDIDGLLEDVARDGSLLVDCHNSIIYKCKKEDDKTVFNFIEGKLFDNGIVPSAAAYNQLELFRTSLPGNANELQHYDKFMTTSDAAICFFFKEKLVKSEDSDFQIYYTDRQGVPYGLDLWKKPLSSGRINNRNMFVLGPSGTGKSFTINSYVMQMMNYGADIVLVDTGHSYSSICEYFKGVYITYTDEKPITTNPFLIDFDEYNEEKREFLKSMLGLLWKGSNGSLDQIENDILSQVIEKYYSNYFSFQDGDQNRPNPNFNDFYEFSLKEIPSISNDNEVDFKFSEYKFILKKFYKGGQYDKLLNSNMEGSLFNERFIVFEIDNIKDHKTLFPIITVIIMDVFIQKMRLKSNIKALIIEEAWKAIASPMMAGNILYLYKTVRKFDGMVAVVTQELNDILGNSIVKDSILVNTDTIILMDQNKFKDNYKSIASLLSLNEIEQNKIFTINNLDNKEGRSVFKETYIKRGGYGEVVGVEVSIFEYIAFSTKRSEKEAFQKYLKFYGDFVTGIETFISDFRASKLSMDDFVESTKTNQKLKQINIPQLKTA